MKQSLSILAFSLALGFSGAADAALFSRMGGQAVYDDVLNITWLQDANYAKTSNYDSDGLMTWDAAVAWADQLDYLGYQDWRLASMSVICTTNKLASGTVPEHPRHEAPRCFQVSWGGAVVGVRLKTSPRRAQ